MRLQSPDISVCIDGKKHSWFVVIRDSNSDPQGLILEHRWCKKCGCLTQVGLESGQPPLAAIDSDGTPHLDIPKILSILTKKA